jgi:hypothetical protein
MLDGKIDLRFKTAAEVSGLLQKHGFAQINGDFKYLTKIPMDSVTQESMDALVKEKEEISKKVEHELKGQESKAILRDNFPFVSGERFKYVCVCSFAHASTWCV